MHYTEALETSRRVHGDEHPSTLDSITNMVSLLMNQGKYDEAEVYYTEALETSRRVLGDEHRGTVWTINALITLYEAWDKPEESQKYRDMLPEEDAVTEDSE